MKSSTCLTHSSIVYIIPRYLGIYHMVTNASAGEIAKAAGLAIPAFFSDAFDQLVQGEGGYLATGEPKGAIARIGQAVGRSACRRYGAGETSVSGDQAARYERACRPYLDTLAPGSELGVVNPFQGGQCAVDGGGYFVEYEITRVDSTLETGSRRCRGPILGIEVRPLGASQGNVGIICNGITTNINCNVDLTDRGSDYRSVTSQADRYDPRQGATARIVSITPCPGYPNDCGNPPPVVVPPDPIPDPTPPPFRFNPVPGIDVGVGVTVNPDGSITFDVGTGDVTVNPFQGDGDGGLGPSDLVPDPGDAGDESDTGDGGDADGEAGPDEELVGLLVSVLDAGQNPNTFDNNSATVYRGIGYVRMGYPNRLGIDVSGGTVISPQFFHAQQRGLTAWAVSANVGLNLRVTPYYRDIGQ